MKVKTLMMIASLALSLLVTARIAQAQQDGEAQAVRIDANDQPTLKFSNKQADKQGCGLYVSYRVMENREEVFLAKVGHIHWRSLGRPDLSEAGSLLISPTRVIFRVEKGDQSHGFDLPRTDLKDKPATAKNFGIYPALQINLKEKLPASDSREQKFGFRLMGMRGCELENYKPYSKFLELAVNDFNAAMAQFREVTAALKQSGKILQVPTSVQNPDRDPSQPRGENQGVYSGMISAILMEMGKTEQAKANAEEAVRLLSNAQDKLEVNWARGEANYVLGNYDEAIANLDKALLENSDHAGVLLCLGKSYFRKDDFEKAILSLSKSVQLKPKWVEAYYHRGITYYSQGDYDRAIADFDKAIELRPGSTGAYINRGRAYFDKGIRERAFADFDQAIKLNPSYALPYSHRGKAYFNQGDYDRALADLEKAIQLKPDLLEAYQNRAETYEKIGDKSKAQADRDKADELKRKQK